MSEWRKQSADRRDSRNAKAIESDGSAKLPAKRKDTRRWCGGKVGRAHKAEWRPMKPAYGGITALKRWRQLVCLVCGKELETWTGRGAPPT